MFYFPVISACIDFVNMEKITLAPVADTGQRMENAFFEFCKNSQNPNLCFWLQFLLFFTYLLRKNSVFKYILTFELKKTQFFHLQVHTLKKKNRMFGRKNRDKSITEKKTQQTIN